MAGHRYWRLRGVASFPGQDTNPMWVCNYKWLDASGDDTLGTPTYSASSSVETGNFLVANMGDPVQTPAHGWQGTGNFADQWIAADYGSDVDPHFVQFQNPDTGASYWLGTQVAIEYSDDGATWVENQIIEPGYIPGAAPYVFRIDDSGHRYWRLKGVVADGSHTGDGFGLNSLSFLDSTHTSVGSGTLSASHTDGGWSLSQATSANAGSTGWYSGNSGTGQVFNSAWIAIDFGSVKKVKYVTFCSLDSFPWTTGREIDVEHSDDGTTWTLANHLVGISGRNGEVRKFRVGDGPQYAPAHRAWRVKSDAVGNTSRGCTVAEEVEFLPDVYGCSLTYGKTPNALLCNSEGFGNRTGAFDLDYGTMWHDSCDAGGAGWICWDSGATSSNWLSVGYFSWRARNDGTYANQDSISLGGLEYTDDDPSSSPTWTRAYSIAQQNSWTANERRVPLPYLAPTNDPDGHRYWRVYQYRNNTSQTGIAELEMAREPGGDNVCRTYQGGTASADGHYSGYDAFKAFDGVLNNGSNEWGVTGGANSEHWLQWDFGSGAAYKINEVRLAPMTDGPATPRTFEVQSSDDGSTWTREWIVLFDGTYTYGSLTTFTRPTPDDGSGAHQFIGIMNLKSALEKYHGGSAGSSLDFVCREFEMAATAGGTNLCTGGTGHWYPTSDPVSRLFDGNYTSPEAYNGAPGCKRAAIWYDFGSGNAETITEVRYTRGDTTNTNYGRAPGEGWLIYSDDGMSWDILAEYTDVDYRAPGPGVTDTGFIEFVISSTAETVGTATATSSAIGYTEVPGSTRGTATATSAGNGHLMGLGTIQTRGQALGQGIATGVMDPFRRTVGTASATSTAIGRAAAVGTISTVGTASATSFADSGSAATGVIATVGASTATSTANALATGRIDTVGSASATSAADAAGSYVPSATVGSSSAIGAAVGIARGIHALVGRAGATSDAIAKMAAVRPMVGSAAGHGSTTGITDQNRPMAGAATATSSALGVGTGIKSTVGSAVATSSAVAAGSHKPTGTIGISTGGSTAIGRASVVVSTVGVSTASSSAAAKISTIAQTVGSATGSSTSAGVSLNLHPMRGSAAGTSAGDGRLGTRADSVGRAHGSSLALGVGVTIGSGMEPPEVVLVSFDDWLVMVPPPSDELVVVEVDDEIVVVPLDDSAALVA
jgi:hypothetical protein